jgi:RimJ/RimL family protein N-acetyltransferase
VITIRPAHREDLDFLLELVNHADVEPFLGGRAGRDREALAAELERSAADPTAFGRFVIEVDGRPAGAMGFEAENRRSRIAHLERLAVHPDFRGQHVADDAARLLQRHLVEELGYHRLQLEIYGFNERAQRHAERAGFVREGVRRSAYWRHGEWMDGVLYALIREDLNVAGPLALLHDYVMVHNDSVRTGDWRPLGDWLTDDAELEFEGVPVGPFAGRAEIVAAYERQPPDDEVVIFGVRTEGERVVASYGWLREPAQPVGEMIVTVSGDRIRKLVVTFVTEPARPS